MMMNSGEELYNKIEHYTKVVQNYQNKIQEAKKTINNEQNLIEEMLLKIVSDRSLSTKERTERMIPLMEKQDRIKVFLEDIETLIQKEN